MTNWRAVLLIVCEKHQEIVGSFCMCISGSCIIHKKGSLSIQPKIPEISVGTSNGTDHLSLVCLEYSGPALNNNQTCSGLGQVFSTGSTVTMGTWNFQNFKQKFLLNAKCPRSTVNSVLMNTSIRWSLYSLYLTSYTTS